MVAVNATGQTPVKIFKSLKLGGPLPLHKRRVESVDVFFAGKSSAIHTQFRNGDRTTGGQLEVKSNPGKVRRDPVRARHVYMI